MTIRKRFLCHFLRAAHEPIVRGLSADVCEHIRPVVSFVNHSKSSLYYLVADGDSRLALSPGSVVRKLPLLVTRERLNAALAARSQNASTAVAQAVTFVCYSFKHLYQADTSLDVLPVRAGTRTIATRSNICWNHIPRLSTSHSRFPLFKEIRKIPVVLRGDGPTSRVFFRQARLHLPHLHPTDVTVSSSLRRRILHGIKPSNALAKLFKGSLAYQDLASNIPIMLKQEMGMKNRN